MFIVLQPYFEDEIDIYEYDDANDAQNQFILNILKEAFNEQNLQYENEGGMFYIELENNNLNLVNIVNNIRAATGDLDIAGAEGRHPRLKFQIVENDQPEIMNNEIGQEGGKRRRRNKKNNKRKTTKKRGGNIKRLSRKKTKKTKKTNKKRRTYRK